VQEEEEEAEEEEANWFHKKEISREKSSL